MAKTFQKKSQSIGVDDHGAARLATFDVGVLIVYGMHFHLKSNLTEASLHGSPVDIIQETILHEVFWIWWTV